MDTAPADAAIDQHLDLGIDPFVGSPEDGHRRRARHHESRKAAGAAAALRRKRILTGLAAVSLVSVLGLVAGFVPMPLALLALAALAGYVYLLAAQSRARARVHEARRRRDARAATGLLRRNGATRGIRSRRRFLLPAGTTGHGGAPRDRLRRERSMDGRADARAGGGTALRAGRRGRTRPGRVRLSVGVRDGPGGQRVGGPALLP